MAELFNNRTCVGIVGLGLIGGSLAKTIKAKTDYMILGYDSNQNVLTTAKNDGVIDDIVTDGDFRRCDIVFVGLYPKDTVSFIENPLTLFSPDIIVIDLCGVKEYVCDRLETISKLKNINFIGAHPMAGREFSGYDNSISTLFQDASIILTPISATTVSMIESVSELLKNLGFEKITITTPQNHDRVIAYTSQLAHVVSSAYVKSPTSQNFSGFSAGSFKDLTRVAKLNSDMWSELFSLNSENLITEIDNIIGELSHYRTALLNKDITSLKQLLQHGTDLKIAMNNSEN